MELLPGEEILNEGSSNGTKVVLTDRRLIYEAETWGRATSIMFFLEDLDSVEMTYRSYPLLVVLGLLSLIVGLFAESSARTILIIAGLLLVLAFFLLRHKGAKFNSRRTSIFIYAKGDVIKHLESFVHAVQQAKDRRLARYVPKAMVTSE